MPKKKPPSDRHSIHIRLNAAEGAALEADLKAMPGIPVSPGVYAKHAVLSYPKLRKLEGAVRDGLTSNDAPIDSVAAGELLAKAGL